MINLTSWHNWVAVALIVLLLGLLGHQLGRRFQPVGKVVTAAFGS